MQDDFKKNLLKKYSSYETELILLGLSQDSELSLKLIEERLLLGEPLQYIVGAAFFYNHTYRVGPGVLIPRLDSECLVEEVIKVQKFGPYDLSKVLDIGAGSGCLGFEILKERKECCLTSIENSHQSFSYLELNQRQLNIKSNLVKEDFLTWFKTQKVHEYSFIISNPPYIDYEDQHIERMVKEYEPQSALFSKNDGLSHIMDWAKPIISLLKPDGIWMCEFGFTQKADLKSYFESLSGGFTLNWGRDLAGQDRYFVLRKKHE